MGSIYKRGKVYWVQYYRNGKPYRETTKSKKEADVNVAGFTDEDLDMDSFVAGLGIKYYF